jgi:hypothetical protein
MIAKVAQRHAIDAAINGKLGDRIANSLLPVVIDIATGFVDVMPNLEVH